MLSKQTILNILGCRLQLLKIELKPDNFLTEITIEDTIIPLVLSLSEYSFNNDLKILIANFIFSKSVYTFVVSLFFGQLMVTEHKDTEFLEFLIIIVRSDQIDNELNFLFDVLLLQSLFPDSICLFL
jgi:hypothetical protein